MSGYELSRQWFDFAYENPDKVTSAQTALYMWLIEANNRKGFSEKFVFNTSDACSCTGIKDRKTIWKAMEELVANGFVTVVNKAKNQNQVSVLSIVYNKVKTDGALDTSMVNEKARLSVDSPSGTTADTQATPLALGQAPPPAPPLAPPHSYKPQTANNKQQTYIEFEIFWAMYDKKVGDKGKIEKKWRALTDGDRTEIIRYIPEYVKAKPDKQFRKDPQTFLNNHSWRDEIIPSQNKSSSQQSNQQRKFIM